MDELETDLASVARSEITEVLQPAPARALADLLDIPMPRPADGLPLMWHRIYLLDRPATVDLGPDGHPFRNAVVAPPGPGRRRMWAGGRVRSVAPLRLGREATRVSEIARTRVTHGRSGELTFVTVRHTVTQGGSVVVAEEQDLVYRTADPAGSALATPRPTGSVAGGPPAGGWQIDVTPPLLFRFSALTYNGHRIHYDRDYSRHVEGYPGLLVHGPLQALMMAEAARARGLPTVGVEFAYRLVSPLFDGDGMTVSTAAPGPADSTTTTAGPLIETAVHDRTGRSTAVGTLTSVAAVSP